jgi:hypothetical protein
LLKICAKLDKICEWASFGLRLSVFLSVWMCGGRVLLFVGGDGGGGFVCVCCLFFQMGLFVFFVLLFNFSNSVV